MLIRHIRRNNNVEFGTNGHRPKGSNVEFGISRTACDEEFSN